MKKYMEKGSLATVLAGLGAGITEAVLVVTPAETLKTKLIHDLISKGGKYNGLFHGIKVIVGEQGLGGIYRGK
jgi:solute carrier family 25 (mitochondrial citrate transporter), member 1